MPSTLRNLTAQAIRPVPLGVLGRIIPRSPIGLYYHLVTERQGPHTRHLYSAKTPREFAADLGFLRRNFSLFGYDDLQSREPAGRGRRPGAVVTFDDGLRECYEVARPLLLERAVPAIFFVTTDFIDNERLFYKHKVSLCIEAYGRLSGVGQRAARKDVGEILGIPIPSTSELVTRLYLVPPSAEAELDAICARFGIDPDSFLRAARPYLSTAQIQRLGADGFTIGAHGRSHRPLASMTPAEVEIDVVESCGRIGRLAGGRSVPYAFPFNGRGVSRSLLRRIRESHPGVGLFFDTRGIAPDSADVINRVGLEGPRRGRPVSASLSLRRAYAAELKRVVMGRGRTARPEGGA
jgi:peptidoglycan/xylan/chitin deacetylase (PgdA/CDA1 family)